MNRLRICLFGDICITSDDEPITANATRATQALLAYLLLSPHRPQSREVLSEIFWGNRSQERARNCLKTTLWRLRKVLEPQGIPSGTYLLVTPAGDISFNRQSDYWLDVEAFEWIAKCALTLPVETMQVADALYLEAAVTLYTGDLLDGFYDNWAVRERERLQLIYLNSLEQLMRFYHRQKCYEKSLENGHKILKLDPLREEVHREMMLLYVKNSQRALAIKQYEICCQVLHTELGISPMAETQTLYAQIKPEFDSLSDVSIPARVSPIAQYALQQLSTTLCDLDKVRSQLRRTIQTMEKLNNQGESTARQ